jgi:hypothetical protein
MDEIKKVWIGWDNGIGNISAVWLNKQAEYKITPVKKCINYTKTISYINRLDRQKTKDILENWINGYLPVICIERPMVNPGRFKATASGLRILEAQECLMEDLNLPYRFIDSKEWQKEMLPHGVKGPDTKTASLLVGQRLFPYLYEKFKNDADSLLMAEYMRRKNF